MWLKPTIHLKINRWLKHNGNFQVNSFYAIAMMPQANVYGLTLAIGIAYKHQKVFGGFIFHDFKELKKCSELNVSRVFKTLSHPTELNSLKKDMEEKVFF